MLAENVEGIANATETVEMLNQAQENLQEVAKNPGIVGTWLQGLTPGIDISCVPGICGNIFKIRL